MNNPLPSFGYSVRSATWCIPAVCLSYAAFPTAVFAETTSGVTVSASTAADSNPFLGVADSREVASFRLELAPTLRHSDGVSDFTLSARAEHIEYLGKFRSVQNLSTTLTAQHRVDARTSISANFAIASNISTSDFSGLQSSSGQPNEPPLPDSLINDITLLGQQTRRNSVSAGSSVVFQPGEFDQLSFASDLNLQRYAKKSGLDDYDFASHKISYARQLNEQLSVGAMFEGSVGDFKYLRFGDARILSPRFVVSARLNGRLKFNSSLGASFTRVDTPQGKLNVTALAGSASLCYRGAQDNFCLNGQRQVVPTALGGIRTQTSFSTDYSVKLSSRDSFQSGTSYSTVSAPIVGGSTKLESVRIFGRLERRLNERARIYVAGAYANSSDTIFAKRSNIQALLGITFGFGRLQ